MRALHCTSYQWGAAAAGGGRRWRSIALNPEQTSVDKYRCCTAANLLPGFCPVSARTCAGDVVAPQEPYAHLTNGAQQLRGGGPGGRAALCALWGRCRCWPPAREPRLSLARLVRTSEGGPAVVCTDVRPSQHVMAAGPHSFVPVLRPPLIAISCPGHGCGGALAAGAHPAGRLQGGEASGKRPTAAGCASWLRPGDEL